MLSICFGVFIQRGKDRRGEYYLLTSNLFPTLFLNQKYLLYLLIIRTLEKLKHYMVKENYIKFGLTQGRPEFLLVIRFSISD